MGGIFSFLIDLIFPKYCLNCGKEGEYWCDSCRRELPKPKNLSLLIKDKVYFDEFYALFDYDEPIIQLLISSLKYRFIKEIAIYFGDLLADKIGDLNFTGVLVPVPLHKRRQKWRGFNQAEEISKVIAQKTKLELSNVLNRQRYHKPQAKLSEEERLKSLNNAFIKTGEIPPAILLIDDVVTTGTTVNECSKILKEAGAKKIIVLTIAKG